MGYYATGSGDIELTNALPNEVIELAKEAFSTFFLEKNVMEVFYDGKYYEDRICAFLTAVKPYTKEGTIYLFGEDDCHWKFEFDDGDWEEIGSRIVFEDEPVLSAADKTKLVDSIIDKVKVCISSTSADSQYEVLRAQISDVLKEWNIV